VKPYRVVSASEDMQVNLYEGPPFKFVKSMREHTKFANCARFSPDGALLCTVGSDMKVVIYDAASGEKKGELSGHTGSVYACSWAPDSRRVATASADKTVKIWDAGSLALLQTATFADKPAMEDMQVGCVWVPGSDTVVSLSLRGDLSYIDASRGGRPTRTVKGHNKAVTALAADAGSGVVLAGSYDGSILRFDLGSGEVGDGGVGGGLEGKGHSNGIVDMAVLGTTLVSCGLDDTLRVATLNDAKYTGEVLALGGQPRGMAVAADGTLAAVATDKAVLLLRRSGAAWRVASSTAAAFGAPSVALSPSKQTVAVGGDDRAVHVYTVSGDALVPGPVLARHAGVVTKVAFSPCGTMLASGDGSKEVLVWSTGSWDVTVDQLVYHQARITALAWAPDSARLATGSLDTKVIVWDLAGGVAKRTTFDRAHAGGVSGVRFLSARRVVSSGADCSIKTWTV